MLLFLAVRRDRLLGATVSLEEIGQVPTRAGQMRPEKTVRWKVICQFFERLDCRQAVLLSLFVGDLAGRFEQFHEFILRINQVLAVKRHGWESINELAT